MLSGVLWGYYRGLVTQRWEGWALVTDLYAVEACDKEQSRVRVRDESGI